MGRVEVFNLVLTVMGIGVGAMALWIAGETSRRTASAMKVMVDLQVDEVMGNIKALRVNIKKVVDNYDDLNSKIRAVEKLPHDTQVRLDEMEKSLAETNEIIQASKHLRRP